MSDLEAWAARRLLAARRTAGTMIGVRAFVCVVLPAGALVASYVQGEVGTPLAVAAGVGLGLFLVAYLRMMYSVLAGRRPWWVAGAAGALAAALSLMVATSPLWVMVAMFWVAGMARLCRTRGQIVALCLVTAACLTAASAPVATRWYHWPFFFCLYALLCGLAAFLELVQTLMWELFREVHAAREATAQQAVTDERTRFSRDLHDLLGHSLSLIAVKSELALRVIDSDPDRARAEVGDVHTAARTALKEVRQAVRGYREIDLDTELAGARAVLAAMGARCQAGDAPRGLPREVETALAWVVREGATNVLKHSRAREVTIALAADGGEVRLELRNDGATGDGGDAGSGLTGLAERVRAVGGTLRAAGEGVDGFVLRVTIPVDDPAGRAAPPRGRPGRTPG